MAQDKPISFKMKVDAPFSIVTMHMKKGDKSIIEIEQGIYKQSIALRREDLVRNGEVSSTSQPGGQHLHRDRIVSAIKKLQDRVLKKYKVPATEISKHVNSDHYAQQKAAATKQKVLTKLNTATEKKPTRIKSYSEQYALHKWAYEKAQQGIDIMDPSFRFTGHDDSALKSYADNTTMRFLTSENFASSSKKHLFKRYNQGVYQYATSDDIFKYGALGEYKFEWNDISENEFLDELNRASGEIAAHKPSYFANRVTDKPDNIQFFQEFMKTASKYGFTQKRPSIVANLYSNLC